MTLTRETCTKVFAVALSAAIIMAPYVHPTHVEGDAPSDGAGLSPYWMPVVSRWESIIVWYAERRGLDPDLVASIIWKESRGVSTVKGPTGAVGLMCVKPFPWRPSAEELENPWTNVAAGTRTLAQVIRDGNGDVYYALAAYNGGWDQIHLRVTRRYATDVLDSYVRAVAAKRGLPADGGWIAVLAVEGLHNHTTITVLGPDRPVARYTEKPWSRAEVPTVPKGRSPDATLIKFEDERGREVCVHVWLIEEDRLSALGREPLVSSVSSDQVSGHGFTGLLD
jgi:hypothetical protein